MPALCPTVFGFAEGPTKCANIVNYLAAKIIGIWIRQQFNRSTYKFYLHAWDVKVRLSIKIDEFILHKNYCLVSKRNQYFGKIYGIVRMFKNKFKCFEAIWAIEYLNKSVVKAIKLIHLKI